jgi:hypothetical protein
MSPLPCFAAHLDGAAGAFYAATSTLQTGDDEHLIVWMPSPTMDPAIAHAYAWAGAADEPYLETPHAQLTIPALAALLFLADTEPLTLDDAAALDAIDRALSLCDCDLTRAAAEVGGEIAEHPECAGPRMARCVTRAARLLKVEA